jgi:hypothetical protein
MDRTVDTQLYKSRKHMQIITKNMNAIVNNIYYSAAFNKKEYE